MNARDSGCPCGICPICSGEERYPDECEDCGRVDAADRRSPYDPTPGPMMLCDACTDAAAQGHAERSAL